MRIVLLSLLLSAGGLVAEAASGPSPFAGTYDGSVPGGPARCSIGITSDGQISGFGMYGATHRIFQRIQGSVSNAGRMRVTVSVTYPPARGGGRAGGNITKKTQFQASLRLDSAGNIVGTTAGAVPFTFIWYRR
jgi:hypothetical protein